MLPKTALLCLALVGWSASGSVNPSETSVTLRVQSSAQRERGAVLLDGDAPAVDTGVGFTPALEAEWRGRAFATTVRFRPTVEFPDRRSGLFRGISGDAAARYYLTRKLMLETRVGASGVSFDTRRRWDRRDRVSARIRARYAVLPSVFVSGSFRVSDAGYEAAPDSVVTLIPETRSDRKQEWNATLLWYGSGAWIYAEAGRSDNDSSLDGYAYSGTSLAAGAGFDLGPIGLSMHANQEQRDYGQVTWRTTWVSGEASWSPVRRFEIYAGLQTELSYRDGERVLDPWTYTQAGVRLTVPLYRRRSTRPEPDAKPAAGPRQTEGGWVFTYRNPEADRVHLVGTFSGWNPETYALRRVTDGLWTITVDLDPGIYEYAFVVDGGEWVAPPEASMYVDDGFGNRNGVLVIEEERQ